MSRSFLNGITTTSVLMTGAGGNAYRLYDTSQGTDAKYADIEIGGSGVSFRFLNDAYTSSNTWLRATRSSGYVIGQVTITAPTITLAGATTITGGSIDGTPIGGASPDIGWFQAVNSNSLLIWNGSAYDRTITFASATSTRWIVRATSDAEGGSNTGSNFSIDRYADDGVTRLAQALTVQRNTGLVTVAGALNAASGNVFNDVGRNRVDNGNMEVAQRALPVTVSGAYSLDRWFVTWTAGTGSISQGTTVTHSSRKQILVAITGLTAANGTIIVHRIEAARSYDLAGQSVTVSFDASYTISAGTTTFAVSLSYATFADNFASTTAIGTVAFSPTGTPATYSATFAVPSAATTGVQIAFVATQATATGNLAWALTSVQLELGGVATPFERVDPALSLMRCERFYQTGLLLDYGYQTAGALFATTAPLAPSMHHTPSLASLGSSNANLTAFTLAANAASVWNAATATATGTCAVNLAFSASADL
jgi:hypothetical protein